MRISIFGSGYVGLVTGTCFAEMGNDVICVDIDAKRVEGLSRGESPLYEPGLPSMLKSNVDAGRLSFSLDAAEAVAHGEIIFIAVGTPPEEDGSADLQYVLDVAREIGQHLDDYAVVVNKSTVPVGTADKVSDAISSVLKTRGVNIDYDVASNPEFLKEGAALADCMRPDRIVIGSNSEQATRLLKALYAPFNRNYDKLIVMDVRSAELTKYAANAMLATKISFMNEVSRIAERVGADIEQVRIGIGSDDRIGYRFINPGCGYGGSCFPKDVRALNHTANEVGYQADILTAVHEVNERQKRVLCEKVHTHFEGDLKGKRFAQWGLSFKPNTDDIREASSRVLMEYLWSQGAIVQAYDPEAMQAVSNLYGERADLLLCDTMYDALDGADALIIVTEWMPFRNPDFKRLQDALTYPVIFDGRNLYDPDFVTSAGFDYYSIGRDVRSAD